MTLQELADETLAQKHRRTRQETCKHEDTYSSGCTSDSGSFGTRFCFDCGKSWNYAQPISGEKSQ